MSDAGCLEFGRLVFLPTVLFVAGTLAVDTTQARFAIMTGDGIVLRTVFLFAQSLDANEAVRVTIGLIAAARKRQAAGFAQLADFEFHAFHGFRIAAQTLGIVTIDSVATSFPGLCARSAFVCGVAIKAQATVGDLTVGRAHFSDVKLHLFDADVLVTGRSLNALLVASANFPYADRGFADPTRISTESTKAAGTHFIGRTVLAIGKRARLGCALALNIRVEVEALGLVFQKRRATSWIDKLKPQRCVCNALARQRSFADRFIFIPSK